MTHRTCFLQRTWLLLVVAALLAPGHSSAQPPEPDYQQWLQLQLDLKLPHKLLLNLDLQARRMNAPLHAVENGDDAGADYRQNPNAMLLLRLSLGYQILPWLSGWVGYAFTPVYFDDPSLRDAKNVSEQRLFEQISTSFNLLPFARKATLSTRTRLEQRFRSDGPGSQENAAGLPHWAHRLRQLVRAQLTLIDGTPWLAVISEEVFVHLNDTNYPSEPGLDQNRAFVGAGYQASSELRLELGYLNQYVRRFSDPNQLNHVLSVSISFTFAPLRTLAP